MSLSFTQVASLWKADKRRCVKPSTYAIYVQIANKHILPFFGELPQEQLNESSIQRFTDGLLARGLSLSSIRDALMILKMIYLEKHALEPQKNYLVIILNVEKI